MTQQFTGVTAASRFGLTQAKGISPMSTLPHEFGRFLRTAKTATYAAQGDQASVAPVLQDAKQLEYGEGRFLYRDIYFGMLRFVGHEVVYSGGSAIWSMGYAGGLSPDVAPDSAQPIYAFLRKALLDPNEIIPIRGPSTLQSDDMLYTCQVKGSLEWFHGSETIAKNGLPLYELRFSGGCLA
ncbi:DUF5680 domain-containing protein [Rhodoferax sp. U11-2br]|uniref:DUF5680 domain-containing protein n=1 Tax=Rhodoferax sp. U11-2br TaxID=2838878 RepID=UPI001BE501D6|nr:DUF5680 domain-containing protein [Rhodoferax sp. U11-2br]MBT3067522.1 hypothetical protein [Rhodoferax sp. U11-2br]